MTNKFHFVITNDLIAGLIAAETSRSMEDTTKSVVENMGKPIMTLDVEFSAEPSEYLKLLEVISKALDVKREIMMAIWPEIMGMLKTGVALFADYQRAKLGQTPNAETAEPEFTHAGRY